MKDFKSVTPLFLSFSYFCSKKESNLKHNQLLWMHDVMNSNFISKAEHDLSLPYSMIWKCKIFILKDL